MSDGLQCDVPPSLLGSVISAGQTFGDKLGGKLTGGSTVGRDIGKFLGGGGLFGPAACHIKWLTGGGCSKPPTEANIMMYNSIFTSALVTAMLNCKGQGTSTQFQSISCSPPEDFEQNIGCVAATETLSALLAAREQLETDANRIDPNYIRQEPNAYVREVMTIGVFGNSACDWCVVNDISQNNTVNTDISCISSNEFVQEVRNNIKTSTSQMAGTATDVTGDIASVFKNDEDCVVANVASEISTSVTDQDITNLASTSVLAQEMIITGESVWMQRLVQGITYESVLTLVEDGQFFNNLYDSETEMAGQDILRKNESFNDLVNELDKTVVGLTNIFESTMGKTLIILGLFFIGITIILIIVFTTNPQLANDILGTKFK